MKTRARASAALTDDYFVLIRQFPLVPIRDDRHLREAHRVIDALSIIPEADLTEGQSAYLDVIAGLTSEYESKAFDELTKNVSGLDLLKHLMEEHELTGSDLGRIIGQRELGAKVLSGERLISRAHARHLGNHFGLPFEIFLRGDGK